MRRRFGRGRNVRGSGDSKGAPIDAARAFERIVAAGIVAADALEPVSGAGIASTFAVVGVAECADGKAVVGYAPGNAGDAALAAIAVAWRLAAAEGFRGDVLAVAPQWSAVARRRLAALATASLPFGFRAVAHTSLAENGGTVAPDPGNVPSMLPVRQVAAGLSRAADRDLFQRAVAVFEGLAAKHGGAVRGVESSVELVLLARRVAAIRANENGVRLEMLHEERSSTALSVECLATAMDRLEGQLRKRLNDRRVRESDDGLRAQLAPALAQIAGVRSAKLWPIGGSDIEVVDLVGVHDDGRPIVGAIRNELTLPALAAILDAALALRPLLPSLLDDVGPPLRIGAPRLLLAASVLDDAALAVLSSLALEHAVFEIATRRGRDPVLELRETAAKAETAIATARGVARPEAAAAPRGDARPERDEARDETPTSAGGGRSRGRGRRGSRGARGPESGDAATLGGEGEGGRVAEPAATSFEEVSLFDLAHEQGSATEFTEGSGGRRSRRGRGRRRRSGRGPAIEDEAPEMAAAAAAGEDERDAAEEGAGAEPGFSSSRRRGRRRGRRPAVGEDETGDDDLDDVEDLSESLVPLEDVPDLGEMAEPAYDDEEEDEGEDDLARRRREAELRARASSGVETEPEPEPESEENLSMPRKRAAIVAHADRMSLLSAVLLARDLRQIEGLWVYGQQDLMTFFRGVATDLSDGTPIYVIGFTASPARNAIQAASLYRGRLAWFDHREWPPEDLEGMREAIGSENLHVTPGAESSLSAVVSVRTRRSRFSDKIVEMATGRFSQHDYERWGRLWRHRLGEIANRSGDRRAEVDELLVGRPSDLAKSAAKVPSPPLPPELVFVSERDFRLVHFHGFTLVIVRVPPELDVHLAARIARERYDAQVSVGTIEGQDLVVLGTDESRGRRALDLSGMLEHLASKHQWVMPLPDDDHVARLRIRDLAAHPERFDDLITEIAMGRSILEG